MRGDREGRVEEKNNPFQSATVQYAKNCVKQGKPIDPAIKRSLGITYY